MVNPETKADTASLTVEWIVKIAPLLVDNKRCSTGATILNHNYVYTNKKTSCYIFYE